MTFHQLSPTEAIRALDSHPANGLNTQQVKDRLARFGENKLNEKKKKTFLQRFFAQFKDVMILILLAAAAVSFAIACVEGNPKEFFEPVLILLIVVLNAIRLNAGSKTRCGCADHYASPVGQVGHPHDHPLLLSGFGPCRSPGL